MSSSADADSNIVQGVAVIRAVAEAYLGDLDQAERLYRLAAKAGCADEDLAFVTAAMKRPEIVVGQSLQAG